MFFLLLCIIFGGASYLFSRLKAQNFFTQLAKYSLFTMSLLSLIVFTYNAWLLPDTVAKFYNGGAGYDYVNADGVTTTFYNSSSDQVAYYFLNENLQLYTIDFIKNYLIGIIGVFSLVGAIVYYAMFHNLFGEKLPFSIEDQYRFMRQRLFGGGD